jgi:SWIM zinc finger
MADEAQVDIVPQADVVIVEAADFKPTNYTVDVLRADGGSCECGAWQFLSSVCGHVYKHHDVKCGAKSVGKSNRSAFCPKTSGRILFSNVKVNAPCPAAVCQAQAG